jgi:tRNA A-37 threonylcarbamoyl transferase component Bud32
MVRRITCPHCGQRCQVAPASREQPLTCASCGKTFAPGSAAESAATARPGSTAPAASAEEPTPPPRCGTNEPVPPPRVAEPPLAEQVPLPEHIGRFGIRRLLGAGAYGTVYLAEDPVLDRPVALKVLRSDAPGQSKARERFLREAKAAAQLHHPHIIPVFDAGTDGEVYYLASEYIHGRTLEDELPHHRQDWDWAADVCRRLAEALAYAHRLGIVHRDVKASNVMVDQQGDIHLMDFGLARRLQSDEKLTKDGAILGTAAYMAPEQASADFGPVGPSSDQYSLGIVLYELLCGEPPFSGPAAVVLYNCLHTEPAAPHTSVPEVPRDLEAICLKAIAKRPEDRYENCDALAEDLRRWQAREPLAARPIGPVERLSRWAQRNPWIAGLAVAATILLSIVGAVAIDALRRVMEEERVLAELAETKVDRLVDIRKTQEKIGTLKDDTAKLELGKAELAEKNRRTAAKIEDKRQEVQRELRQKLSRFLEQEPAKWIFPTADTNTERASDEPAKPAVAPEGPPLAVDPPGPGASVRGEALAGKPFGVGLLSVQFASEGPRWRPDELLRLSGRGDVVYYPAYTPHAARGDNAKPHALQSLDVHFLFRGSEPLTLTLEVGRDCVLHTTLPVADGAARQTLPLDGWSMRARQSLRMDQWWTRYARPSGGQVVLTAGPPAPVHTYLVRMLAHRLGRRVTTDDASYLVGPCDGYLRTYRNLLVSKANDETILRLADMLPRQEAVGRNWQFEAWNSPEEFGPRQEATPLPQEEPRPRQTAPLAGADDGGDELATHVPRECYYARFANPDDARRYVFGLEQLAGNPPGLGAASGLGVDLGLRLLRQLALDGLVAGRGLIATDLISDIAVIGTDAYFQDGAAIGVLVKAKDNELLGALLRLLREYQSVGSPAVRADQVTIGEHPVSRLRTRDGSVRSFYATSGDFHLISNSKYIVRRFLEAGQGQQSLAQDPQFPAASRKFRDTERASFLLFVSEDFWKQLLGAPSVIETLRRYRALADLELVRWARRTAAAEAIPCKDIHELIGAKLLPESLLRRPDRSRPQMAGGVLIDSLRGLPGTFLPIPDAVEESGIEKGAVSAFEWNLVEAYTQEHSYATNAVRRLGPLVVTASLPAPEAAGVGSISLDVQFAFPLRELLARAFAHPALVQILGPGRDVHDLLRPPSTQRIAPLPEDLAFVEIGFRTEAWRTFFGLREWEIPFRIGDGRVELDQQRGIQPASFYLGETAPGGLLGRLTQGGYLPASAKGYATSVATGRDPLQFRRYYDRAGDRREWVVFTPYLATLMDVTRRQGATANGAPAQIRMHLGSASSSKLADTLRALAYVRARRWSGAHALLLEELMQQFHLPPLETRAAAAEHDGGGLVCPLGGDYTWNSRSPIAAWTGTKWSQPSLYDETTVPPGYQLPVIDQLRGADISLRLDAERIEAHVEIEF